MTRHQLAAYARAHAIGRLSERMVAVATRVHARLVHGDWTVYAADDGIVYMDVPEHVHGIPSHWIAGTFRLGEPFGALVDDLRCLRDSRRKDWIID